MADWQFWIIAIVGVMIILAIATTASNVSSLKEQLSSPLLNNGSTGLIEFGLNSEFGHIFVNPVNVTHLTLLTGEGGTSIHLIGGGNVPVYDNLDVVAKRLGLDNSQKR